MTSRRRLLAGGLAAMGASAVAGPLLVEAQAPVTSVPFFGARQAGIITPAQDRLAFGAFDVQSNDSADLERLLRTWTAASVAMTQGQPVQGVIDSPLAPPVDTGEASGLGAANLTITFGFGPSLFAEDRFGLSALRPDALADLPTLRGDHLVSAQSGGDIGVQACADDPQVAFHAVRNLARLGRGIVSLRWMQLGFGRTSTTSRRQATPRNLMGFKDGTNNVKLEDNGLLDEHVWVGVDTDQAWMSGGTYLVARRIRMRIESWDRTSLDEQERVIGRHRTSGAPLNAEREFDTVDLASPRIADDAHIRLAAPDSNSGARILRRGYSFTDGVDPLTGELDAGLFFICFQRDPRTGFVAIQQRLGQSDALNEYIRHTGSALFACPPGVAQDGYVGQGLLAQH